VGLNRIVGVELHLRPNEPGDLHICHRAPNRHRAEIRRDTVESGRFAVPGIDSAGGKEIDWPEGAIVSKTYVSQAVAIKLTRRSPRGVKPVDGLGGVDKPSIPLVNVL